jgi:hypothetical protein
MAKKTNQQIADESFDKNKDLNEVYVSSDGYPFATENAANLHKNTSGKKGLKVFPFARKEAVTKSATEPATVKLDKLKLAQLIKLAESKGIRPEERATKAQLIEQIEIVLNSEIEK